MDISRDGEEQGSQCHRQRSVPGKDQWTIANRKVLVTDMNREDNQRDYEGRNIPRDDYPL